MSMAACRGLFQERGGRTAPYSNAVYISYLTGEMS
jgi:hypothetical protein